MSDQLYDLKLDAPATTGTVLEALFRLSQFSEAEIAAMAASGALFERYPFAEKPGMPADFAMDGELVEDLPYELGAGAEIEEANAAASIAPQYVGLIEAEVAVPSPVDPHGIISGEVVELLYARPHSFAFEYDLTPKELGVAICVWRGEGFDACAKALDIPQQGVTLIYKTVLEKTGSKDEIDLARIVQQSVQG